MVISLKQVEEILSEEISNKRLLKRCLAKLGSYDYVNAKMSLVHIKNIVSDYYGFDISSKNRDTTHVRARMVYCYVARNLGFTTTKIGDAINRNHSTVLNSIKDIDYKIKFFRLGDDIKNVRWFLEGKIDDNGIREDI